MGIILCRTVHTAPGPGSGRGPDPLSRIVLVPFPVPVLFPFPCSVNVPAWFKPTLSLTTHKTFQKSNPKYVILFVDSFAVYINGEDLNQQYSLNSADYRVEEMSNKDLVFGRLDTNVDWMYCNCQVDDVKILETELSAKEVKELYKYS